MQLLMKQVMCATWHPKDDLIGSASLDQTVRYVSGSFDIYRQSLGLLRVTKKAFRPAEHSFII